MQVSPLCLVWFLRYACLNRTTTRRILKSDFLKLILQFLPFFEHTNWANISKWDLIHNESETQMYGHNAGNLCHPYILSTTVLSDLQNLVCLCCVLFDIVEFQKIITETSQLETALLRFQFLCPGRYSIMKPHCLWTITHAPTYTAPSRSSG